MRFSTKVRIWLGQGYFSAMTLWERMRTGVGLNLMSPEFCANPFPALKKLREADRVHWSPAIEGYWVTRFDDVQEVLRDSRFGADIRQYEHRMERIRKRATAEQLEGLDNPSMLNLDPPDHSRLRKLVTHGFMFKYIQSLEPGIKAILDRCLARVDNAQHFDVIDAVAKPLPAFVIAEMMGLPESDHEQFQAWSEDLIAGTGVESVDNVERNQRANRALIAYFKGIIEERRSQPPSDDLIGQLLQAEEEGDKLNTEELYNTCVLLLVAGHETTTRLIGNGLYALLRDPDQLEHLKAHPDAIPDAIEEMLRFEPPVMATARFAREDVDFHGVSLKRGDQVFLSIAAANRDPAANDQPDQFDVSRDKVRQVSFGHGIHLCLGAALARLEAKVVFTELLARYPDMTMTDPEPHWGANPFFRGLDDLMIDTAAPVSAARAAG